MTKELDIHPAFLLMAHLPLFRRIQYNAESPEYRRKKKKRIKKTPEFLPMLRICSFYYTVWNSFANPHLRKVA